MSGGPRPIRFGTGLSARTRAVKPDDPSVLISVGNSARIFCTREYSGLADTVFFGRRLVCDAVPDPSTPSLPYSSVWNYSPLEYWEDNGDYYFTAVFPFSNSDVSIDNSYRLHVGYLAGNNTDLMVARTHQDATVSTDPVDLHFMHTTSAVRFLFGKSSASDQDNYELTAFELQNLVPSGTFMMTTRVSDPPSISFSNWGEFGNRTNLFSWTADTPGDRKTITHPAVVSDPDGYTPMGWYYMVPQTLSTDASVRFSVSYNNGEPVETILNFYGATDQNSELGTAWLPNCVYNYYITITQSGLDLTVKTVPWDEVQVITDDFNFEG
ncbi:MAG: fimbrillin family protein [Bacteroidales bacterium]|nr:fimbrillin family protein [Bacteroidales bacterium]